MARRVLRLTTLAAFLGLAMVLATNAVAQEAPRQPPAALKAAHSDDMLKRAEEFIKPRPPEPIPDDPPPHEGAMLEMTQRIGVGDTISIEVVEALPGLPISGDRVVRPDGMVSLGFYGHVHVTGLTPAQVKVKVILHLRRILTDEVLGLVTVDQAAIGGAFDEDIPPVPDILRDVGNPEASSDGKPKKPAVFDLFAPPALIQPAPGPGLGAAPRSPPPGTIEDMLAKNLALFEQLEQSNRHQRQVSAAESLPRVDRVRPKTAGEGGPPLVTEHGGVKLIPVPFEDSLCVAVGVTRGSSATFDVIGTVYRAGSYPWTGRETVLSALQQALVLPTADRLAIRLHRPPRGKVPARSYLVDLDAIIRGDTKANLQLFPGDRLVVPGLDGAQPALRKP